MCVERQRRAYQVGFKEDDGYIVAIGLKDPLCADVMNGVAEHIKMHRTLDADTAYPVIICRSAKQHGLHQLVGKLTIEGYEKTVVSGAGRSRYMYHIKIKHVTRYPTPIMLPSHTIIWKSMLPRIQKEAPLRSMCSVALYLCRLVYVHTQADCTVCRLQFCI